MEQVVLVTGGARGIGRGIVKTLAQAGFQIVVNYAKQREAAEEVVTYSREAGVRAQAIQADISLRQDRERLVVEIDQLFGRLDILVNNAGVAPQQRVDILDSSEDSFDRLISINLKGPYFLTQRIARWMITQVENKKIIRPKIINISSMSAYATSLNRADYCISKAGISMMTQLYAHRLAPAGISVFEIRPGLIATEMTESVKNIYDKFIAEDGLPISRWGQPEDIGKAVLAIAQDYFPYSTGDILNLDGGFHLRRF